MPTLLRTNIVSNPVPSTDLTGWLSGGTLTRAFDTGLWRVSVPAGGYGYASSLGQIGKFYAGSIRIKGTVGENVGIASTDNIYGAFCEQDAQTLPAGLEVASKGKSTVSVSGSTLMIGVFTGAVNAQILTQALIEEVSGSGILPGPFFYGDTPNTPFKTYSWTGVVGNSSSTESSVLPRPASNYSAVDLEFEFYSRQSGLSAGTLNDHKFYFYKNTLGISGSINDLEKAYFASKSGIDPSLSLRDHKMATFETATVGNYNDSMKTYYAKFFS